MKYENCKDCQTEKFKEDLIDGLCIDCNGEIEHEYTEEIICPYCGYEYTDAFEWSENGKEKCNGCDNNFYYSRNITVDYSTSKKDDI